MLRKAAVLRPVDQLLRMFNSRSNGKRLGLHGDAHLFQHRKGIAGAVPHRQHHMMGFQHIRIAFGRLDAHSYYLIFFAEQSAHLRRKPHFAAQFADGFPDIFDRLGQPVRPDMRLRHIQNLFRGPGQRQFLQHLPGARVLCPGIELSVGKSPCAAFAKLHVALRLQLPRLPKMLHRFLPFFHRLPALDHDWALPGLGQNQRGKQTGRTKSNHHGAHGKRTAVRQLIAIGNRFCNFAVSPDTRPAALAFHRTRKMDLTLFARIHRLPAQP